MSRFKPGPAKTRDGRDAVIYEVRQKIFGRIDDYAITWQLDGKFDDFGRKTGTDLVQEPFRFEAKVLWTSGRGPVYPLTDTDTTPLIGKRGVLVFTEEE